MDLEGTIQGFSELRAIIPGFAVDFNQLLNTAMTGSTDDFISLMRGSLQGAGMTPDSPTSRLVAGMLEKTMGFSSDQIDRILDDKAVTDQVENTLDDDRNSLLRLQIKIAMAGFGAVVGAIALKNVPFIGPLLGAAIGGGLAFGGAMMLNDFVVTGNQVHPINGKDIVGALPDGPISKIAGGGGANVEHAVRKVETSVNRLANLFQGGMSVKLTDLEKGVLTIPERQMRMA